MADVEANATQEAPPKNTASVKEHNPSDVDILYKIYLGKRLDSQAAFYKSRVRENNSNANFTFLLSTAVMSVSAFVAAVSAVVSSPFFSLLSAVLPALAALLAAFRQLYGWERQSSIYQDALMGLERLKLLAPDKDEMDTVDLTTVYPQLVTGGEEVFTAEVNQWGQFVQNADKTAQEETPDTTLTNNLMSDLRLSDEQVETIRRIMAAGNPKSAYSEHTITVHPEETSALPAGAANTSPQTAQSVGQAGGGTPLTVTSTRTETATIYPPEADTQQAEAALDVSAQAVPAETAAPISVKTTRVDTTTVEQVIPSAAASATEVMAEPVEMHEPPPEAASALAPGAMHVDAPQAPPENSDVEAQAVDDSSHNAAVNEVPPPEAMSALTPGAMHVDAPQAPPENPNPEEDPNANG